MHIATRTLAFVVLVLSASLAVVAQDTASVAGVITDVSGAVLPAATVTLSKASINLKLIQTTDNHGLYRFPAVPPGTGYTVTANRDGFAVARVSDITLNVQETRTQNIMLTPGSVQTVEVSAKGAVVTLNSTDATIGNNMSLEQLDSLPVYDRTAGVSTLFTQQPGVDSYQGAVTGARIDQSSVTVDGMDVNDLLTGQTFLIVANAPVDSVDQFSGAVAGLISSVGTEAADNSN